MFILFAWLLLSFFQSDSLTSSHLIIDLCDIKTQLNAQQDTDFTNKGQLTCHVVLFSLQHIMSCASLKELCEVFENNPDDVSEVISI